MGSATRPEPNTFMGSGTHLEPNTGQRIFLGPHSGLSVFYIDPIYIILSRIQLKIAQK
jgi:hypothetical protein